MFFPPVSYIRSKRNKNESKEQNPKNRSDTLSLSLHLQCARCISIQQQFNSILFRFYSSILLVTSSWDTAARGILTNRKKLVEEAQRNQKCGNRFKKIIIKTIKITKTILRNGHLVDRWRFPIGHR